MKLTMKLLALLFGVLMLGNVAYAQSPREELKQMVEQLQQTPNDNALREKIIKLATSIKPSPAIPEEAREPFVMGATVLKKASDPAGASKAVDLFTQALNIAPWFADAYYNRAMAREAAGQFEPAIDDLKLYLEFKLTDSERREAQDKIYALKASAQLVSAKKSDEVKAAAAKAAADTPQAREAALLQKVEGARFVDRMNIAGGSLEHIYEIKNGTLFLSLEIYSLGDMLSFGGYDRPGLYSIGRASYRDGAFTTTTNDNTTFVHRIRPDGQALLGGIPNFPESIIPRE